MDERNFPAHYVATPPEQLRSDVVGRTTVLLDRMCIHGGSSISVKELEAWVRPPIQFLGNG